MPITSQLTVRRWSATDRIVAPPGASAKPGCMRSMVVYTVELRLF